MHLARCAGAINFSLSTSDGFCSTPKISILDRQEYYKPPGGNSPKVNSPSPPKPDPNTSNSKRSVELVDLTDEANNNEKSKESSSKSEITPSNINPTEPSPEESVVVPAKEELVVVKKEKNDTGTWTPEDDKPGWTVEDENDGESENEGIIFISLKPNPDKKDQVQDQRSSLSGPLPSTSLTLDNTASVQVQYEAFPPPGKGRHGIFLEPQYDDDDDSRSPRDNVRHGIFMEPHYDDDDDDDDTTSLHGEVRYNL